MTRSPSSLQRFADAQVEPGIVDEQHDVGPLALDALDELAEHAAEHRQMAQHVEQADDAHLAGVMKERHALAREQIAADAEQLQRGIELLQLANDFRGVEIAGGLAGDDGDFIVQRERVHHPPERDAAEEQREEDERKKRMRSGRLSFHSSVKKSAVSDGVDEHQDDVIAEQAHCFRPSRRCRSSRGRAAGSSARR